MEARRCLYLRTKTDYVPSTGDTNQIGLSVSPRHYWCLRTMKPIGPDDNPVDAALCGDERACFVAEGEA